MNQAIASIIRSHIEGLDFVDKIAGMTRALTFDMKGVDKDNNPITVQKTYPVACCVTPDECENQGAYKDLMPNSQYKTVIYFEDNGVSLVKSESNWKYYTSNVRLVCWINVAKILGDTCNTGTACTLAAHLIVEIIRALPEFPQHHNPVNFVYSEVVNQDITNPSIFSQYTYDEKHTQYLMYPYDYFALDIKTDFAVCMKGSGVYDSDCGHRTDTLDTPVAIAATGVDHDSFTANWNAVTGATGYIIDVATDSGFVNEVLSEENIGNVLSILITGLNQNTTYYYRVRAYNDYTESASSNTISLTTLQHVFSDWFLPSKDELALMRTELYLFGVGGFAIMDYYWSSSEYVAGNQAWANRISDGNVGSSAKDITNNYVRACRSFTSTTSYSLRDSGPAGGLIFYKSGNNYLEAAPTDQSAFQKWSNVNIVIGTTGTAIGTGQANTTAIINQAGHTDSAAKLCDDLIITV
jgi:hypothetical protein